MPFAFLPKIDELLAAVESYGEPSIGVVYDLANGYFVDEDIVAGLRKAAPRLRLVHVSDTGRAAIATIPSARARRLSPARPRRSKRSATGSCPCSK